MKAHHITAYVFAADVYCPEHIERWATSELRALGIPPHVIERAAQEGRRGVDVGTLAHRSEGVLELLAGERGIDNRDVSSYDSGDFPKVVFSSDGEETYCGAGHAMGDGPRFTVIENTPGYLSEDDDPPVFERYEDAVAYLNERAAEYADDPDGNYRVEYGVASGDNLAAVVVHDDDRTHDLGRVIQVVRDDG